MLSGEFETSVCRAGTRGTIRLGARSRRALRPKIRYFFSPSNVAWLRTRSVQHYRILSIHPWALTMLMAKCRTRLGNEVSVLKPDFLERTGMSGALGVDTHPAIPVRIGHANYVADSFRLVLRLLNRDQRSPGADQVRAGLDRCVEFRTGFVPNVHAKIAQSGKVVRAGGSRSRLQDVVCRRVG